VPPDTLTYKRIEVDQSERDKYVAGLIDQLRELETKTDPKGGAQSAQGKSLAALEALGIASTLVKLLAGWALDHQAGLALKGVKHVALAGTKLSEGSDHSSRPATDDDHRHEWYGRIWGGRLGEPPRVCRRLFGLSHAAMAGCSIMA